MVRRLPILAWVAFVVVAVSPCTLRAVTVWDETTNGDLSGNRLVPTSLSLSAGVNSLFASSQGGDVEYVRIVVPNGSDLISLINVSYSGLDQRAFIGVQEGDIFTEAPATANPANLLGYTHFGPLDGTVGNNILPQMATGFGAQGFTPPLGPGSYTFWIQQLGNLATYRFDFVIDARILKGDMNGDTAVNNLDIAPFSLALTDPVAFSAQFPTVPVLTGDIDNNGQLNNLDISPFSALLVGGAAAVPEPASFALLLLGSTALLLRRARR